MYCLKCGRDTQEDQVFCDDCRSVMAKYPIKPGAAVQLPKRKLTISTKRPAPRKKQLTAEERIHRLQCWLRNALIAWFITFLLFCAALYPAVLYLMEENHFGLGQNYSVITPAEESAE